MRCAAEHRPGPPGTRSRKTAAIRWTAALAAACLLAACTGTHGHSRHSGHHARSPRHRLGIPARVAPHIFVFNGGGAVGGGAPVIFIGAGPAHGSRPKITVPPIPPAQSSLTIAMPL